MVGPPRLESGEVERKLSTHRFFTSSPDWCCFQNRRGGEPLHNTIQSIQVCTFYYPPCLWWKYNFAPGAILCWRVRDAGGLEIKNWQFGSPPPQPTKIIRKELGQQVDDTDNKQTQR